MGKTLGMDTRSVVACGSGGRLTVRAEGKLLGLDFDGGLHLSEATVLHA